MKCSTPYEQSCFDNAKLFTSVRGRRVATRVVLQHDTFEEAKASGSGDGRTMIYAVTPESLSAHICNV